MLERERDCATDQTFPRWGESRHQRILVEHVDEAVPDCEALVRKLVFADALYERVHALGHVQSPLDRHGIHSHHLCHNRPIEFVTLHAGCHQQAPGLAPIGSVSGSMHFGF